MKAKGLFYGFVFVTALLLTTSSNVFADTNVSGFISADTTWTEANSPYVVTGSVIVNSGVTLTIEPGVTVKLNSGKALQVDGTLIAKGTSAKKITFTRSSGTASNWGYILFNDSSADASYNTTSGDYESGSILEYCVVEYAGGSSVSDNGAIRLYAAHPFINSCTIRNNSATGIYGWSLSSALKIKNSTINNNTSSSEGGGIYTNYNWATSGTLTISNNTISNNTASNGGGIHIGYYTNSSTIISNNIISNNTASYGGGVYGTTDTKATISNNIIINNTAKSEGGGIYSYGTVMTITNNVIANNTATSGSGGIHGWQYYGATGIITNNHILGNTAPYPSALYFGTNSSDGKVNNNTITSNNATGSNSYTVVIYDKPSTFTFNSNNLFNNTTVYELNYGKSQGYANLTAKNNWWGTSDDSTIQGKIYDWGDDSTKAIVDYIPYETALRTDCPISPPTGLTATAGTNQITLNWTANAESDTKGYKVYYGTSTGYPYSNSVDVGNVTSYTITGLTGSKYYVTVTAYDADYNSTTDDAATIINENQTNGNESWYAEEKTVTVGVGTIATPTPSSSPIPSPAASPTPKPSPTPSPASTLPPLPTPAPTLPPLPTPQVSPSPLQEGIVFGIVNDQDEQSLKGVTVTITGKNSSDSTETDENGYYEFTGLSKGDYTLTYEKEGYLSQTQDMSLKEGELKDLGTVTMEQVVKGKISGYVVNIKGDPIESVRLKLKGVKTKVIKTASSDADGFFEFTDLDADTYVIFAKKKGYKKTQQKVVLEEGDSTEIEIEMKKTSKRVIEMMEDGQ